MYESLWNIPAKRGYSGYVISSVCATNEFLHYGLSFRESNWINGTAQFPIVFSVESIPRQVGIANGSVYFSTLAEQMLTRAYFELRFSRIALRMCVHTIGSKVLILLQRSYTIVVRLSMICDTYLSFCRCS